jgi:hypothetical protein
MATFIDQLTDQLTNKRELLKDSLHTSQHILDEKLRAEVLKHWHTSLPPTKGNKIPAYAVDGSSGRAELVNGSAVFVAQALLIGGDLSQPVAEVEILSGTVLASTMDRFADLMRQSLEIGLAKQHAQTIPEGSILYLDGALYGTLPQLYPLRGEGISKDQDFATILLHDYHDLFETCRRRNIRLISIAKTNRQALFSKVLQKRLGRLDEDIQEVSDSALFDELTEQRMGYSTPIVLGKYSFSSGASTVLLEGGSVGSMPAIVSFFVRLENLDDALRIDVLGPLVGEQRHISDLDFDLLEPADKVLPIIEILRGDYGGMRVYNALAYISDLEVRLTKRKMYDVYLPMIRDILGEEVRINRSQRRFVD